MSKLLFIGVGNSLDGKLSAGKECREVQNAVANVAGGQPFSVDIAFDTSAADVVDSLRRHSPTILHFSGHGTADGSLVMDDRLMPMRDLGNILDQSPSIQLLFFNACFTNGQASALLKNVKASKSAMAGQWCGSRNTTE